MIGLNIYEPTPEQIKNMGRIALSTKCEKLIYKEVDTGYLAYHPDCGRSGIISKKTLGQSKNRHLCPFCSSEIKSTTKQTKHEDSQFVRIDTNEDESYGYYVYYDFELGKEMWCDCEQVFYGSGNDCYHRYIKLDMFGNNLTLCPSKEDWKYSKRKWFSYYYYSERFPYENCMYEYNRSMELTRSKNKKKYLEQNASFITKSNQKKLVMDNIFSPTQIMFIKIFDLKSDEEVKQYNKYIKFNKVHAKDFINDGITLNIHYLDYLSRNNIDLGVYYHYLKNLTLLGFKYDKPTDFKFRSDKIEKMACDEKDKQINIQIENRASKLPRYYEENVSISPFENAFEIRNCGKVLHNCIGGFVSKYAKGETDIYHVDLDGAIKVALEIRNNELIQAMEDHNVIVKGKLLTHIRNFCNQNKIKLGSFA